MTRFAEKPAAAPLTGTEKIPMTQGAGDVYALPDAIANRYRGTKGTDIASATTTDIGAATGNFVHITGTTTITGFGTADAGIARVLVFDGVLTLTHNGTSLILPTGANITTAAGDSAVAISEGAGNWRVVSYQRKNGEALAGSGGGSSRGTVSALATSGSVGIDWSLGDYFTLALSGNVSTFTFSNLPGSGQGASLMIRITQDSTPRTVGWPASFKWAAGAPGVVSTGSGDVDVLAITTFDNGTTWDATLAKAFS